MPENATEARETDLAARALLPPMDPGSDVETEEGPAEHDENEAAPAKSALDGKRDDSGHDGDDGGSDPDDASRPPPGPESSDQRPPLVSITCPSGGGHPANDRSSIVGSLFAAPVPDIPVLITAHNVTLVDERRDRDRYRKLRGQLRMQRMAVVVVIVASAFVVYWAVDPAGSSKSMPKCVPGGDKSLSEEDKIDVGYGMEDNSNWVYDGYPILGYDIAIFEKSMVVGMPIMTLTSISGGAAYVFSLAPDRTWTQEAELVAEDNGEYHSCDAHCVAIFGDTIVVGDCVFSRDDAGSWSFQQKLFHRNQQVAMYRRYVSSVDMFNDTIVIGAYGDISSGGTEAAVFFYMQNGEGTWKLVQKVTAGDGKTEDLFGYSIGIYANVTVVTSPGSKQRLGCAYVFSRDQGVWVLTDKLGAEEAIIEGQFGNKVAIFDNTIIVTAIGDTRYRDGIRNAGAVYVYSWDAGWRQKQRLVAGDAQEDARFGYSIQATQHFIVVGAPGDIRPNGIYKGGAYIFSPDPGGAWVQTSKISHVNAGVTDFFGSSALMNNGTIVV
eukprot:CAMPEP_0194274280 /NCGR_PEP_ID=MMETSP0169-20130528/7390_1 /TAXON_ID=218684 /ORGANISM="Corethron pennatum, Strain L29A3" /LENGTH=550 /DNA_ID=CAMNT_0039017423 /DNA_START=90 /DNA_END=1739 /DNA_ORIENTATION=+